MPPARKTISIDHPSLVIQVSDDQSRTLVDPGTSVAYHSASGAIAETRHVYLCNSGVQQRLSLGLTTSVLEIGLGTGMAMLVTLDAALAQGTSLRYTALENDWLDTGILQQLNLEDHVNDAAIVTEYLSWRASLGNPAPRGVHRLEAGPSQQVIVHHHSALEWTVDSNSVFDAIYFDPFAPVTNPELWEPAFLNKMHSVLKEEGRLVTYCVNRKVRDDFESVGFQVARVRGPLGGKREVMIATRKA